MWLWGSLDNRMKVEIGCDLDERDVEYFGRHATMLLEGLG